MGIYWVFHHWMFNYIVKLDNIMIFLNVMLLLCISFLPFPSALMGAYGKHPFTAIFKRITLALTGLSSLTMWRHATIRRRLVHPQLSTKIIRTYYYRIISAILIFYGGDSDLMLGYHSGELFFVTDCTIATTYKQNTNHVKELIFW